MEEAVGFNEGPLRRVLERVASLADYGRAGWE